MNIIKRGTRTALVAAIGLAGLALSSGASMAQGRVIVAATGGAYEKALRENWFDPFTAATGIEVVSVSATGGEMRAQSKVMVETGNVTWDIFFNGEIQAGSEDHRAVAEDLSAFCEDYADRADLVGDACTAAGVRVAAGATLMAYNADAYGDNPPKTWADMWDVDTFKGGRAFPNFNDPWRVMAAALLADGVNRDDLFPLDVDRALAKLETIKPDVELWWKTGDQSVQGFRNGDYTIGEIWLTRANALKKEGHPVGWSYEAAFLVGDRAAIIQGAPNKDNALKLVAFWLDTIEAQAGMCEAMLCTPPSGDAIAMMSEEARSKMPTGDQVKAYIVSPDAEWINANKNMLLEAWNNWLQ